ncbi:hypothetical protein FHL15_007751 [Xylaria flabelliformis]|uniref:Uncharacterized protein n=1 Tax=Xylaria flabelliformis TaxID=2512241 RepID=A0A553HTQ1_9PEZI|nr:hypothetical protein FHL15_007751 [Xylaria flabelliformis]
MNTASPSKRRALAPVDANTRSPLGVSRLSPSKLTLPKSKMALGSNVVEPSTLKRPIQHEGNWETPSSAKKRRLSDARTESHSPPHERTVFKQANNTQRPRSISPEDPSLFDSSTIDNSQVTVISEPDVNTNAAPRVTETRPRQGSMTREEARQKAEILRLRLGLASYKVRTNQLDVPLERLQVRPLAGKPFLRRTPATVLLPPLQATSPRSIALAAMSRSNEEKKRLSSPARIEGTTTLSQTVLPTAPLQRRESGSSVAGADVDKSPIRIREPEQTLPPACLSTPQRRLVDTEDALSDSERGGAAEGLLSLSQSSPASTLKGSQS